MLVLQLHHGKTMKHQPKIPYKQEATKQWNLFWCQTSNPFTTPVAGAAVVADVAVGAAAASGAAIEKSSSSAWSGPMGGAQEPEDLVDFWRKWMCFVCVFSFWKKIKSMKVYWNLKDRNGNSAKDNLDSKRFRDWWVWCEGAKYSQMLRLLSRVFEGCGNKQSHKYWLKVSMSTDLRYQ